MMRRFHIAITATIALIAFTSAACGEVGAGDPTPVRTWKITPASGAPTAATSMATLEPETPAADRTPGAGITIALVGINSTFDEELIQAPAGTITIEFDNRDGGVLHNVQFFRGDDARGESVGTTALEVGPIEQTLTMTLEPGEYYYQCDAHPTTMKGTLRVS